MKRMLRGREMREKVFYFHASFYFHVMRSFLVYLISLLSFFFSITKKSITRWASVYKGKGGPLRKNARSQGTTLSLSLSTRKGISRVKSASRPRHHLTSGNTTPMGIGKRAKYTCIYSCIRARTQARTLLWDSPFKLQDNPGNVLGQQRKIATKKTIDHPSIVNYRMRDFLSNNKSTSNAMCVLVFMLI